MITGVEVKRMTKKDSYGSKELLEAVEEATRINDDFALSGATNSLRLMLENTQKVGNEYAIVIKGKDVCVGPNNRGSEIFSGIFPAEQRCVAKQVFEQAFN